MFNNLVGLITYNKLIQLLTTLKNQFDTSKAVESITVAKS